MKESQARDNGVNGQQTLDCHLSNRKWISLAILLFINLINYMDRLTVSAILEVEFVHKNIEKRALVLL